MHHLQNESTKICIDNISAIELAKNPIVHGRSNHIDAKYLFNRQQVKEIIFSSCFQTEDQVTENFTKGLKIETFEYFKTRLGMTNLD